MRQSHNNYPNTYGPAAAAEHGGYHSEQSGAEYVTPPLGALALNDVEVGEVYEPQPYGDVIADAEARAGGRAQEALENGAFVRTPEVRRAVEGYYGDHIKLAATIEFVAKNPGAQLSAEEMDALPFDTYATRVRAERMLALNATGGQREAALKEAMSAAKETLFNEACIGATTLKEADVAVIAGLGQSISEAAVAEGYADQIQDGAYWRTEDYGHRQKVPDGQDLNKLQRSRLRLNDEFWKDSRHAGQLLFHNTGSLKDITQGSEYRLTSRTGQVKRYGGFRAETAVYSNDGKAHTNVPHWSELYDYGAYKGDDSQGERHPGTIAVPLAEIIKTAPYARNGEYGVVSLKDAALDERVTTNDTIGTIDEGGFDIPGTIGTDRVFFSDYRASHAQEAHDYEIDFGRGMRTPHGNTSRILITEGERQGYYKEAGFGAGEGIPELRVLPFDDWVDPGQRDHFQQTATKRADQLKRLAPAITQLQAESRDNPAFKDKLVVPLRQGVMEFRAENARSNELLARYQQDPEHSVVSAASHRARTPHVRAS